MAERKSIGRAKDMNKASGLGLTKAEIRSKILLRLKTQKEEDRNRKSKLITVKLLRNKVFKKAKRVMFYIAFGGEVNTEEMIREAKKTGKLICVPVCRKDRETMHPAIFEDHAKLKKGPYGVLEPVAQAEVNPENLDLIIVPGLAFDKKGNRLGRGKGCYDRFLRSLSVKTPSIGLAFDFQILPLIPTTSCDVSVKEVICS
ncbi:MAG: 5-formyltetrahydrofolate cyclo-ligase [Candidatus Omnitrophica bacterium]|jgi:5-formyltetrahydrofolate cyclo-ligase|nr:5-formyltetrahydrofolate cyclo-ligase [Candidatus Omnitrophota bacterium]MDD3275364.1 5-formyltetrahydrofolate cyclo-ligase [Candidatus Omnitrophota bacterium]MDD5077894.1 5-formyltetrahydrofolate cyclo-ligase [Candidatus Omnitrophota bacterium]